LQLRTPLPVAPFVRRLRTAVEARPGLAVSGAGHALVVTLLAWLIPEPPPRTVPPPEPVSVELLSAEEFARLTAPEEPAEPMPEPAPTPEPPPLIARPRALTHAPRILSDTLGPEVRRGLARMASDTRFEQICGVEAMEQIAKSGGAFKPQATVAYATADPRVAGNVMVADGAAFFSGGHWFQLAFRCETTPDRLKVVSFDFAVGEEVTEGRGLDAGEDPD
jgi:hypothetical protein